MTEQSFSIERFRKSFLLLLVVLISLAFGLIIRDFITPVMLAAIFCGLAYPLYEKLLKKLKGRAALASAVALLTVFLLIIGPLLTFLGIVASQAGEISQAVTPWLENNVSIPETQDLGRHIELPQILAPYQSQIFAKLGELSASVGQFLFDLVAAATRGTASFLLALFIMLYAMFFFFRDGQEILSRILYYMPLQSEDELRMVDQFVSVTRATLRCTLIIGVLQGTLAGIAFAVVGIPAAAFWGTLMLVLSVIPGVGTALVWLPATGWLYLNGETTAALGLAIWCLAVVGMVDQVLRPRLVGRDTEMSDLMIMLSTLGGLLIFGATGLVVGPIIAALFVTVWELYGEAFALYLPEVDLGGTRIPEADPPESEPLNSP